MKQNTVVIGLTGQTGAGKSTVGESLLRRGAAWVDADLIAHDVADNEKVCLADLALEFTIDILNVDGTLNRKKLADIVFHDKAKLRRLNEIISPILSGRLKPSLPVCGQKGTTILCWMPRPCSRAAVTGTVMSSSRWWRMNSSGFSASWDGTV